MHSPLVFLAGNHFSFEGRDGAGQVCMCTCTWSRSETLGFLASSSLPSIWIASNQKEEQLPNSLQVSAQDSWKQGPWVLGGDVESFPSITLFLRSGEKHRRQVCKDLIPLTVSFGYRKTALRASSIERVWTHQATAPLTWPPSLGQQPVRQWH